ncbi:hypothetical protein CBM2626_A90032 [Cupriavidus taiwanensis]|nr:hypothetical protein CBM2626_A90032 [Cupriavidus taiwanensis]
MLPSPACGGGQGVRAGGWHTVGLNFVAPPGPHPDPLPQAGEGVHTRSFSVQAARTRRQ